MINITVCLSTGRTLAAGQAELTGPALAARHGQLLLPEISSHLMPGYKQSPMLGLF